MATANFIAQYQESESLSAWPVGGPGGGGGGSPVPCRLPRHLLTGPVRPPPQPARHGPPGHAAPPGSPGHSGVKSAAAGQSFNPSLTVTAARHPCEPGQAAPPYYARSGRPHAVTSTIHTHTPPTRHTIQQTPARPGSRLSETVAGPLGITSAARAVKPAAREPSDTVRAEVKWDAVTAPGNPLTARAPLKLTGNGAYPSKN